MKFGSFPIAACPGTGTVCKFGATMRFSLRDVSVIFLVVVGLLSVCPYPLIFRVNLCPCLLSTSSRLNSSCWLKCFSKL